MEYQRKTYRSHHGLHVFKADCKSLRPNESGWLCMFWDDFYAQKGYPLECQVDHGCELWKCSVVARTPGALDRNHCAED